MADVILENLTKIYGSDEPAVRDLDLHVRDGELLVLVGPSGCGKTTTLRLIAGLEKPTDGVVRIDGRNVNRVPPRKRNIAMVFQDSSLYPHMSVHQNMAFGLKMRGIRRRERDEKVHAAAHALGIEELLHRKPSELSGGQRQRAALGRALVRRPQCFLLDEPLSNLDPNMRTQLRAEIKLLHRQLGATIIYVTHDQEEAMTLGDRIAVMQHGAIQQIGAPLEVYQKPVNRFVAGFIGSPAMNFIEGSIGRDSSGIFFYDGQELRLPVAASKMVLLQFNVGNQVVAGIRPAHMRHADHALDHHAPLWLRISHVEPLGDQLLVHGQTALGATITAQVAAHGCIQPNQQISLCVDPEDVHFFESGEAGRHLFHGQIQTAFTA